MTFRPSCIFSPISLIRAKAAVRLLLVLSAFNCRLAARWKPAVAALPDAAIRVLKSWPNNELPVSPTRDGSSPFSSPANVYLSAGPRHMLREAYTPYASAKTKLVIDVAHTRNGYQRYDHPRLSHTKYKRYPPLNTPPPNLAGLPDNWDRPVGCSNWALSADRKRTTLTQPPVHCLRMTHLLCLRTSNLSHHDHSSSLLSSYTAIRNRLNGSLIV